MKTIRMKLMLTMLAMAFFITIILSLVAISAVDANTNQTLMSTAQPLSEQTASSFNATMRQYSLGHDQAVKSSAFTQAETDAAMLDALKNAYSNNVNASVFPSVFKTDGTLICAENEVLSDNIDKELIKEAGTKTTTVVSDLFVADGGVYFTILESSEHKGEKVVASVTIDSDVITGSILNESFGENGEAYLVNSEGKVILHTVKKYALESFDPIAAAESDKDYKDVADAVKAAIDGTNGSKSYTYDKKDYVIGFCKTEYFDGTLINVISVEDFSSYAGKTMMNVIVISAILLVLTIITSIIFAGSISKPITSATKRIRLLAQGNLSDPVDVWYSKDELGVLTNSLEETVVCLRQYINLITVALTQILEGNLCHRMEGTFKGDFEQIKTTFNEIFEGLTDTFASINTAAEQVNSGAFQVSNSAQEVSQGSTQQASAIEELSATLKDVAKQSEQNAEDSKNVYNIVASNTEAIGSCNEDMEDMLDAINEIHTSSDEISKIIKVIDEIAFQTNILALNAAVEAAREGSKGFGVVADEVRRLASRSAEAAKQTAALIENSAAAVSKGSEIARKTASSLHVVVDGSDEIQGLVKNISEASDQQTEAITQINTGLDQISTVVAANTSSSVATASASEELSSQSLILKNMIARFKLVDERKSARDDDMDLEFDDMDDMSSAPGPADDEFGDLFSDDDKY